MVQDSGASGKKPIKEVQELRARKPKLERVGSDITERMKTEEKLRQSEQRFRSIFDNANDIIGFVNTAGRIIEVNKKVADILGYEPGELVGKNFMNCGILPIKNAPTIIRLFRELVGRRGLWDVDGDGRNVIQLALNHKKGHAVFVEASTTAVKTGGRLEGFLSVLRDITERKTAEQALKESEEKYRAIFELAPDGILTVDLKGMITSCNTALLERSGYSKDDFVGRHISRVPTARLRDVPKYVRMFNSLLKGNVPEPFEFEWIHKDGTKHCGEIRVGVLKRHGKTTGFQVITRDITERKKAEQALRESEERLSLIYNTATDIMILLEAEPNGEFNIVTVNDRVMDYFAEAGIRKDMICNTNVRKFFQDVLRLEPEDIAYRFARFREVANSKRTLRFEVVTPLPDGSEITHETTINPIVDEKHQCTHLLAVIKDITERKKTQEALREGQQQKQAIIDSIPDIAWLKDKEGRYIAANEPLCKAFGIKLEDLVGKTDFDISPEDLAKRYRTDDEEVVKSGKRKRVEEQWGKKNGNRIWIETIKTPIHNDKGEVVGTSGIARDITERKRAEEKIEAERKKLETYIEAMVDGVSVTDANGVLIQVNKALAKIHNYSPQEMVGKRFIEFVAKRDIPKARNIFVESIKKKKHVIKNLEITGLRKDGSEFSAMLNIRNLWDKEGKLASVISAVRDITEHKKAEEALRESEEKLRNVVERASDGIAILQDGVLKYVNPRTAEITGYTVEEMMNTPFARYVHPDELPKVADVYERRMAGEEIGSTYETVVRRKDGSNVHIEVSGGLITYKGKTADFAFARDITERKYAEQRLLQEQAKLKSLASQLTLAEERERRRIAIELHDRIGQSLAISKMNLEALRKSEHSKKTDETLDEICNLLAQTVADTRTLTFDLSSPVLYELGFEAAVAEWLTERIQNNHGIATQFEDDGRPKPLDDDIRILLFRNVRELLINVVKHAHAQKVKVSIRKVGRQISVSVEDDGVGFDPAVVAPTAAKRPEFGLFSIRQRLEELGGHLEIDSEPGLGCMVTMTAPLKQN